MHDSTCCFAAAAEKNPGKVDLLWFPVNPNCIAFHGIREDLVQRCKDQPYQMGRAFNVFQRPLASSLFLIRGCDYFEECKLFQETPWGHSADPSLLIGTVAMTRVGNKYANLEERMKKVGVEEDIKE
jgi:hypothetical protein